MAQKRFGIFSPIFESGDYLSLLNLDSNEAVTAVFAVVKCCRSSKTPHHEIVGLLDDANWRRHIVAAVAVSALNYEPASMIKIWATFDSGSWVTPQLAVSAFLRDPNFSELAKARILARCPLESSRLDSMTPLERHIAAGPAGMLPRSAKAAAELLRLVELLQPHPEWLPTERSSPDLVALLADDVDRAALIGEEWLAKLKAILQISRAKQ